MIYIRSMAAISPDRPAANSDRLVALEPDYRHLIDAKLLRRMSRVIKMGVAAAIRCLGEAGETMPGAIVTGTAYGCLEDTGIFLEKLVSQREEALSPTPFIQSTHNTIGAQIALLLQCTNYNNTFVHRGFSFESALLDSLMLLEEGAADTVLTGSVDEITKDSHAILQRFGLYRHTVAGEGAAFFLLTRQPSGKDLARLEGLDTLYKPASTTDIENWIEGFLSAKGISLQDVDAILLGRNGDPAMDQPYDQLEQGLFAGIECSGFKHRCGEYPTASSFALLMATGMLKSGCPQAGESQASDPQAEGPQSERPQAGGPKRILVYNHYLNIHHSLMLVSRC